jgi:hypothetical protein
MIKQTSEHTTRQTAAFHLIFSTLIGFIGFTAKVYRLLESLIKFRTQIKFILI